MRLNNGCAVVRRPTFEELSSAFLVFVRGPMIEDRMYFVFLFFSNLVRDIRWRDLNFELLVAILRLYTVM